MPTTKKILIQIQNIFKNYQVGKQEVKVLKDISFEVGEGDFLVVLGPSGSGKSTCLHILLGLEPPSSGRVVFLGKNLYDRTDEDDRSEFRKQHIGMVYQQPNWVKSMTVIENVAFPLMLHGQEKEVALQTALKSLDKVGMTNWAHQVPTELSGGQQQRVAMARGIVHNPEVVIADEPTGNLDFESGKQIMELLKGLNDEGRTVIMVTHDIEYVRYANRAVRIFDGKVAGYYDDHNMGELMGQLQSKRAEKIEDKDIGEPTKDSEPAKVSTASSISQTVPVKRKSKQAN